MTKLLLKLFIKDHENRESKSVRAQIGKLSGIVGILWTVMSVAFGVYTVFFHPFSEGRQPIDLPDRSEDGGPSGEDEP